MARREDKNRAIELRLQGYSYSQIKDQLGINKSTLSGWLAEYPLSPERIKELRDRSPRRIESYRNTMTKKRLDRLEQVYQKVKKDIFPLSKRDLFIGGLFLYWGEGVKVSNTTAGVSNTDPRIIKYFLKWLLLMGVKKEKIVFSLQLYADMDADKELSFWLKELNLPKSSVRGVRIKKSNLSDLTYKNGFGHGTCNLCVYSRDLKEYILMSLQCIKDNIGTQSMRV